MKGRHTPLHLWGAAGLAGAVSGGVTLGVGELAGSVVAPATGPFLVVGNTIVDMTPEWLKSFAIETFGENDKIALLVSLGVVLFLLSVVAGMLQYRRPPSGLIVVGLLGTAAVAAALNRPEAQFSFVIPSVVGVLVGGATLWLLIERLRATVPAADAGDPAGSVAAETDAMPQPDRRRFLLLTAGAAGLAVLTAVGGRRFGQNLADVLEVRDRLTLPAAQEGPGDIPADVELDVDGITPFTTPNGGFYRVDTALQVPTVDPDEWRLRIHGMVDEVVELDFDDVVALPLVERMITLTCVSNQVGGDLAGNAVWLGYPLKDLLEQAGPSADADMVLSTSVDGYTASTPLEALTDGRDALLAIGMNGEPLPLDHGFPARMVVPGLYGFVSATKWVIDLEVTRFDQATAYWTDRGWAERAPIKTASRIDVPGSFAELQAGSNVVAGVAWAQHRGIEGVEVRVDDGPWQEAELAGEASLDTWRQWRWEWDAEPGRHTLRVRATDGNGETQTEESVPPIPNGASGWHSVVVEVV